MVRVTTAAFWLLPAALALYVLLFPGTLANHPAVASGNFQTGELSAPAAAAAIAALLVVSGPTLWGLWELKRLFEGYATGAIFTVCAARQLRRCGFAVLLSAAKTVVGSVLLSLALSIDLPKDHRALMISFSSDDLALLLIGGILLVIARVMEEAARLAEENAAFI
jgi:hypothetical protein